MNPQEVCALHRKNHYDLILLDLQMPGMDGFQVMEAPQDQRRRRLPAGARDHRPARPQAARAAGRRQGFRQQALRPGRSQDAHPQHAGSAAAVQEARELQQGAGADGAGTHRRAARKRSPLSQPDRARLRLVLGAGRERQLQQGFRPGAGDARHPGRLAWRERPRARRQRAGTRRSASSCRRPSPRGSRSSISSSAASTPTARSSNSASAASRCSTASSRFIGYRGIGVEITAKE